MRENPGVSFNIGFLKKSADKLAENHLSLENGNQHRPIKPVLEESRQVLEESYRELSKLAKSNKEISPAAEWLIDNFYIIQEQIVQIGIDFPKEYQKSIPLFKDGEFKGLPKVYELVLNLMNHTDNIVDMDVLTHYVQKYQEGRTLMQGELWAIPIMIRFILIEKLAQKASRILYRKSVRTEVNDLLSNLDEERQEEPGVFSNVVSEWLSANSGNGEPLQLVEIYNQLQNRGRLWDEQKRWLTFRFRQYDMTLEEAMRIEAQKQSRLQVSIQNAVNSLRQSSETDWSDFVEECSVVDKILRLDPAAIYSEMDFQTRDSYRRVVEGLSRRTDYGEREIAEQVLLMVEEADDEQKDDDPLGNTSFARQHVGFYLKGEGYPELAKKLGYRMSFREKVRGLLERNTAWYVMMVFLSTIILMMILWVATGSMSNSTLIAALVLAVALFPALDLSVSGVNRFLAFLLPPRILPKMDYKEGIPEESRTLVVVPTLFTSPQDVHRQIENLEIRSLANPDPAFQFILLSDFIDSPKKEMESDKAILNAAYEAIEALNKKYRSNYGDKFFFLHRERLWNEQEGAWMGWERKRGKLEEFNRLLFDPAAETTYTHIGGDFKESIGMLPVKFVITLDSDTKLPPDSARNLVRTIAHPLNRARYDSEEKRITNGYGIIQPRISIPPESSRKTWFSRIFSGNVGLDPYSTAVSDIYQDLAGEAIFTGKGIYDVEAFHAVLDGRFPENRILSHDLIESTYLRTGLATDIELFDEYPSTYVSFSKRNHRWIRGDWQIAAWLFPQVPLKGGKENNTINLLSKWKIFDNLRRSLNPFFLTIFFIAGWFLLPGAAWIWTAAAFGILAFPIYISLYSDILNRPARVKWKLYVDKVRANLKINSLQALCVLMILPHQAVVQLDAVIRTLYRLKFSRKSLLEWTTASHAESTTPNSFIAYIRGQFFSVIVGFSVLLASIFTAPQYLWIVFPFFVIWAGAPFWLWFISKPVQKKEYTLSEKEKMELRKYARRTWFYFERFVNEEHFWLPPDNYQEKPNTPIAERTSPTNIGLALVSTQVAYNRGYITLSELLERVWFTLNSMEQLERYEGHFYNWYETRLGEVLHPKYISTVDSGNLAAGLISIRESISKTMRSRGVNQNIWDGLTDTVITVQDVLNGSWDEDLLPVHFKEQVNLKCDLMLKELKNRKNENPAQSLECLKTLKSLAADLSAIDLLPLGSKLDDAMMQDLLFWQDRPLRLIEQAIYEQKALIEFGEIDTEKYSPDELIELEKNGSLKPQVSALVNKWKYLSWDIVEKSGRFVDEMDFSFLYLKKRGLFTIGYNVEKAQLDLGTYDLLASEARIASYIAIAKGDITVEHWFRLSRRLTSLSSNEILLSWGGTMFEYLMPLLFMKTYPDTLLNHTGENVIRWQKEYGVKRNRPWGQSESAYYFLNMDMHYQYRAFGAPGLGLRRGLAEEYVVAPYASMLSLMVDPASSLENLKRLEKLGGFGLHGFYDAVDYTPSRMGEKDTFKWVKTYMVHHHGMSLLAIENVLNDWEVQNWFHEDPRIQGCELILQEKIPRGVPIKEPHPIDVELEPGEQQVVEHVVEHAGLNELDISPPRVHLLSNGEYSSCLTHAGTGTSKAHGISLTGWDADPTMDPLGFFFYIRDPQSGKFWSSMHQPVKRKPDRYDTWFHNGKIVTSRVDDWIETTTTVAVSPDDPMELRKLTLTNYSREERTLELTSYAEVVLNRAEDHNSHPAFSKLFVQTDYLAEHHSILVKRRPRSEEEKSLWMIHTFAGDEQDNLTEPLQFETDRSVFIGRGRSLSNPAAMDPGSSLSGSLGNISDPIVSLHKTVKLGPGEKKELIFGLGYADTREEAERLADTYDNLHAADRAFDLALVYSSVELNHLGLTSKEAHNYQKLASYVLYSDKGFRSGEHKLRENRGKQHELWAYGISGDFPLIVFRIQEMDQIKSVKTLLKAHNFWRLKGVETELLVINDHAPGYIDEIQEAIMQAIQNSPERDMIHKRAGVFLHRSDKMPSEDLTLILTVAHAVFENTLPDLSRLRREKETESWLLNGESDRYRLPETIKNQSEKEGWDKPENLQFFNGYGGFSESGDEYHILINPNPETGNLMFPPAPWINVISNPSVGFIATEKGAGYTWSENSRENKLTGWSNDPVSDSHSEAFYIRDEENKLFWSPTPGPAPGSTPYKIVHGFGFTQYDHAFDGLDHELIQFVDENDPVKISIIRIHNSGGTERNLSVFRYTERVLGVSRNRASRTVIQDVLDGGSTILARNHYNNEFAGRVSFSAVAGIEESDELNFTTNRKEFIGRNRSLTEPGAVAMSTKLAVETDPGTDPCAAFQVTLTLEPGESRELIFIEGETETDNEAQALIRKYGDQKSARNSLDNIQQFWKSKLGKITITTPDKSLDLLMNGWLMYQNLSCRMWARTAYYQAGGAYGYRDQLQDSAAALYVDPEITKKQILLHAEKQFKEGDVLHWWHPPTGRGIRSKISDDRLWLAYVTDFYIRSTGDKSIFDEKAPWITARKLEDYEHEVYLNPEKLNEFDTVYEHCCRAIDISLKFGKNGLPLIGAGDWNDGMNRVGEQGKGESVWLGFFIYGILNRFTEYARKRNDSERADRYKQTAEKLRTQLNTKGWDGEWYLRAFYDDGTTLGSFENEECRIDAISQAWAVITGAAESSKAETALLSAEKYLVSEQDRIIRLLTPPFDATEKNPGYIKGYIPGVRENGGQYTHAALWLIKAMAEKGMGEKAVRYLNMINPVNHTSNPEGVQRFKVEPYVISADVYGEPPLTGMGGWSWYTGSGAWFYRIGLESILGFSYEDDSIILKPSVSSEWKEFEIHLKVDDGKTEYRIRVKNPDGLETGLLVGEVDGKKLVSGDNKGTIPIKEDGLNHFADLQIKKMNDSNS
ncbi:glycosyltransferase 36 [Rhodohalobacter sp. SW132]|uniref:GH36-type glycosyl hydrolase domain-containing protein n=1 Tax=Rhodohalobacter sp. SW132 TaxID=2293433 RepID=UPI000E269A78|nr:glucoamylase family protein [Rhodohalobacter sp. SW132]REL37729.1 glycosyltransferase 36 [Rhodohalobacter sp. SW132]